MGRGADQFIHSLGREQDGMCAQNNVLRLRARCVRVMTGEEGRGGSRAGTAKGQYQYESRTRQPGIEKSEGEPVQELLTAVNRPEYNNIIRGRQGGG